MPTIDLHGMTRQAAVDASEDFVLMNQGRDLLIITGNSVPMQDAVSAMLAGHNFSHTVGIPGNSGIIMVYA